MQTTVSLLSQPLARASRSAGPGVPRRPTAINPVGPRRAILTPVRKQNVTVPPQAVPGADIGLLLAEAAPGSVDAPVWVIVAVVRRQEWGQAWNCRSPRVARAADKV